VGQHETVDRDEVEGTSPETRLDYSKRVKVSCQLAVTGRYEPWRTALRARRQNPWPQSGHKRVDPTSFPRCCEPAAREGYTGSGPSVIHANPVPPDVGQRLATIARALNPFPQVVFGYLFGSRGSGQPGPLSDVDVAVYLEEGDDIGITRLGLIGALTRHLGTDDVDVVVLNTAPIALAGRVLAQRQVIVDRYESLTTRAFLDFGHFEHRLLERRFARGRQGSTAPEAR
jgi:uncharacterized protein